MFSKIGARPAVIRRRRRRQTGLILGIETTSLATEDPLLITLTSVTGGSGVAIVSYPTGAPLTGHGGKPWAMLAFE